MTERKEIPLLVKTNLIKPIQFETKTVTRRLRGLEYVNQNPSLWKGKLCRHSDHAYVEFSTILGIAYPVYIKCPYGIVGDIIWVRESWAMVRGEYEYKADKPDAKYPGGFADWLHSKQVDDKWKPSIHMPRVACRIRLKITDIEINRLQDISEKDCILEGIQPLSMSRMQLNMHGQLYLDYTKKATMFNEGVKPRESFKSLINSIDGAWTWKKNPWVWVIRFELIKN